MALSYVKGDHPAEHPPAAPPYDAPYMRLLEIPIAAEGQYSPVYPSLNKAPAELRLYTHIAAVHVEPNDQLAYRGMRT
jgi:hypothetical protein